MLIIFFFLLKPLTYLIGTTLLKVFLTGLKIYYQNYVVEIILFFLGCQVLMTYFFFESRQFTNHAVVLCLWFTIIILIITFYIPY